MQICIECSMSTINEILKRLQTTMSQSEISRETGIPQPKLSRWGAGAAAAGADDALKLLALDQKISAQNKIELDSAVAEGIKVGILTSRRNPASPGRRELDTKAYAALGASEAGQDT